MTVDVFNKAISRFDSRQISAYREAVSKDSRLMATASMAVPSEVGNVVSRYMPHPLPRFTMGVRSVKQAKVIDYLMSRFESFDKKVEWVASALSDMGSAKEDDKGKITFEYDGTGYIVDIPADKSADLELRVAAIGVSGQDTWVNCLQIMFYGDYPPFTNQEEVDAFQKSVMSVVDKFCDKDDAGCSDYSPLEEVLGGCQITVHILSASDFSMDVSFIDGLTEAFVEADLSDSVRVIYRGSERITHGSGEESVDSIEWSDSSGYGTEVTLPLYGAQDGVEFVEVGSQRYPFKKMDGIPFGTMLISNRVARGLPLNFEKVSMRDMIEKYNKKGGR